jgi:hypothetical protein
MILKAINVSNASNYCLTITASTNNAASIDHIACHARNVLHSNLFLRHMRLRIPSLISTNDNNHYYTENASLFIVYDFEIVFFHVQILRNNSACRT